MTRWERLPASFQFSVQDTSQKDIVKVLKGRLPHGSRKVEIAPFAKANMDKVAQIIAQLRTQKKPDIEYITNLFIDIHRSSGKSHVVGAIMMNEETQGDHFDLDTAARQGLSNKIGNCDRVNAAGNRMMSLFDVRDPVLYYWTTQGNHNIGLIGDPRMPKYGEKNTIVLDTYPVFPMPHTLAEASYQVRIPEEGVEGHADLEIRNPQDHATDQFDASHLPSPISEPQQKAWLKARGWPTSFGADVVKAWHDAEIQETGNVPDRWAYLFSCKDPSVRYHAGETKYGANNRFPLEFVRQRTEAFLQLHQAYPENALPAAETRLEGARLPGRRSGRLTQGSRALSLPDHGNIPHAAEADILPSRNDVQLRPETGMAFQHVTPMHTIVTDLHTGEVLMEMHGSQIPVDKVNHGFPIKDPQNPSAIHPDYVSPTDPFRCHDNVKIGRVELPPETKQIMQQYFPAAAAEPGYFEKRAAEIKSEYEAPLPPNHAKPLSATQWRPKRLTASECFGTQQAQALTGAFGVVPVDYQRQNVGGMGPAFAGAEIKTAAQRRQYIAQTSKAAFDDFSMRAGNPKKPEEMARYAPYGGGNLAQFMNGKAGPEEQAHFIAVDVIVHTSNKFGEPRRVVAPHFFQIAEVPQGKQAILDYGDGNYFYGGNRPGMSSTAASGLEVPIKTEPVDDEDMQGDSPMQLPTTLSVLSLRNKRPASDQALQRSKRHQAGLAHSPSNPSGAEGSSIASSRSTRTSTMALMTGRLQRQQSPSDAQSDADFVMDVDVDVDMDDGSRLEHSGKGKAIVKEDSDSPLSEFEEDIFPEEIDDLMSDRHAKPDRNDAEFIAALPEGVWDQAQMQARASAPYPGVSYERHGERYLARMAIHGQMTSLGSFSSNKDRKDLRAKAMAIAAVMVKEAIHGKIKAMKKNDAEVIASFPEAIWEQAQITARSGEKVSGIVFQKAGKRYIAQLKIDGKQKTLGSFSLSKERPDMLAKAMAIATLKSYEAEHDVVKRSDLQKQRDEKAIANFSAPIWKTAQEKAREATLPKEITVYPATTTTSVIYAVKMYIDKKSVTLGSFSVNKDRHDAQARAMALATLMAHEEKHGKAESKKRNDAQIISGLPPGVWEEAQAYAAKKVLPVAVRFAESRNQYLVRKYIDGVRTTIASFSVNDDRDDDTAKKMALAMWIVSNTPH